MLDAHKLQVLYANVLKKQGPELPSGLSGVSLLEWLTINHIRRRSGQQPKPMLGHDPILHKLVYLEARKPSGQRRIYESVTV